MAYTVEKLDLSAVIKPTQIVPKGNAVRELVCLAVPDGASFQVRFGGNGDWITISAPFTMEPTGEEQSAGVEVRSTTVQPGVSLELIVVRGAGLSALTA